MSGFLQSLVSADDSCGPVNPLSSLVKGVHGEGSQLGRDLFVPVAGSSSQVGFRTHGLQSAEVQADAQARAFFEAQQLRQPSPYNLDPLRHALPQGGPAQHDGAPAWAADFMRHTPSPAHMSDKAWGKSRAPDQGSAVVPAWAAAFAQQNSLVASPAAPAHQVHQTHMPMPMVSSMPYLSPYQEGPALYAPNHVVKQQQNRFTEVNKEDTRTSATWQSAFDKHLESDVSGQMGDSAFAEQATPHESLTARPHSPSQRPRGEERDLLAKTAGELLQNMSHDMGSNTKMRDSSFMRLMQKLRDKEVTVQGNKMVENITPVSVNLDNQVDAASQVPRGSTSNRISVDFGRVAQHQLPVQMSNGLQTSTASMSENVASVDQLQAAYDDMNASLDEDARQRTQRSFVGDASQLADDDFDLDNELLRSGPQPPTLAQSLRTNEQQQEWGDLQEQWDNFQATSTGIRPAALSGLEEYPFQTRNPYLLSRHHRSHLPTNTLLEREADAQLHPDNPQAWLNLGLKQQENEREALAIQALQHAVALNPQYQEAWLALAVSYTNDNMRSRAYDAIDSWAACKPEYAELVKAYRALNPVEDYATGSARHAHLTGLLVEMARASAQDSERIDPDVQIALGVLFNSSEEYDKACDCFVAALSVRPDDPHLYNRLGATLANSGRAQEALEYYYRALELQPDFARATFNLAIACINLNAYQEAASHLLRALDMQQNSDADVGEPSLQHMTESDLVESSNLLWETLASCCNSLHRPDLAAACQNRNLAPFRTDPLFQ